MEHLVNRHILQCKEAAGPEGYRSVEKARDAVFVKDRRDRKRWSAPIIHPIFAWILGRHLSVKHTQEQQTQQEARSQRAYLHQVSNPLVNSRPPTHRAETTNKPTMD